MTHDDPARVLKRFVDDLNEAWTAAGPPSFAELEAMSRKFTRPLEGSRLSVLVLAHATTQAILAGRRRTLPKWHWVASFITVLRAVAAQHGVNPNSLGSLAEWKTRHAAVYAEFRRAKSSDHEPEESDSEPESDAEATEMEIDTWRLIHNEAERAGRASVLILAKRTMTLGWWQDYRDVVPDSFEIYLSLEPTATLIRGYETELISDLLQTEEYAAAAIRAADDALSATEVRRRVELRMVRQQILTRPNPTRLWMLLDERALRRPVGTGRVMRADRSPHRDLPARQRRRSGAAGRGRHGGRRRRRHHRFAIRGTRTPRRFVSRAAVPCALSGRSRRSGSLRTDIGSAGDRGPNATCDDRLPAPGPYRYLTRQPGCRPPDRLV